MYAWALLTNEKICFLKETFAFNYKHFSVYLLKDQFFSTQLSYHYHTIISYTHSLVCNES